MAKSKKKTEDIMEEIASQIQEQDLSGETVLVEETDMAVSADDVVVLDVEGDVDASDTAADEAEIVSEEAALEEALDDALSAMTETQEGQPVDEAPIEPLAMTQDDVRLVEAILFASSSSVSIGQIAERFPADRVSLIPDVLEYLQQQYQGKGVNLVQRESRWALRTAADLGDSLRLEKEQPKKFTRAAMETMAIIAYHQPVTRAEIENIRGVATSAGALDALMEAGWIKPGKRREVPGRPVTWLTTKAFLDHFGLEKIEDLPGMEELKAAGLLDKRPAIEAMPTPDLFDGESAPKEEDDPQTVTDEDLIGDSGIREEDAETAETSAETAEADEAEVDFDNEGESSSDESFESSETVEMSETSDDASDDEDDEDFDDEESDEDDDLDDDESDDDYSDDEDDGETDEDESEDDSDDEDEDFDDEDEDDSEDASDDEDEDDRG